MKHEGIVTKTESHYKSVIKCGVEALNHNLTKIQSWADQWLITLVHATECLIISNKKNIDRHPTLYLNYMPIKEVKFHKHLGITLTQSRRWSKHTDDLSTKCFRRLDLMKAWQVFLRNYIIILVSFFQDWTMVTSYLLGHTIQIYASLIGFRLQQWELLQVLLHG